MMGLTPHGCYTTFSRCTLIVICPLVNVGQGAFIFVGSIELQAQKLSRSLVFGARINASLKGFTNVRALNA
ncbi:hypothetical protein ACP6PL_25425 [Dapis sp. BLCC M126]|uniref:hypothetical protein n=1 Tax=Dapis sp. BLCC M126 TaxID=3400189 RepID=UPI003CF6C770